MSFGTYDATGGGARFFVFEGIVSNRPAMATVDASCSITDAGSPSP